MFKVPPHFQHSMSMNGLTLKGLSTKLYLL